MNENTINGAAQPLPSESLADPAIEAKPHAVSLEKDTADAPPSPDAVVMQQPQMPMQPPVQAPSYRVQNTQAYVPQQPQNYAAVYNNAAPQYAPQYVGANMQQAQPYGAMPSVSGTANAYPMFFYQKTPKEIERDSVKEAANVGGGLTIAIFLSMIVVAIIVMVTGFLSGIVRETPTIGKDPYSGFTPMGFYLYEGLTSLAAIFIPSFIVLTSQRRKKDLRYEDFLPFNPVGGKKLAVIVFAGMGICMVAQLMAVILSMNFSFFGFDIDDAVDISYGTRPLDIVMNTICTALIPALVEEFAYRGVVLGALKRIDVNLAIVGSAFLFGMLHGNLAQIPFAFVVGLVLAYVRIKTDSMLPNILIHFGNNFYAVIVSTLGEVTNDSVGTLIDAAVMAVLAIVGFVCIYYLTKNDKDFFKLEVKPTNLTFGEKLKAFFTSGTVIAGTVLLCLETLTLVKML